MVLRLNLKSRVLGRKGTFVAKSGCSARPDQPARLGPELSAYSLRFANDMEAFSSVFKRIDGGLRIAGTLRRKASRLPDALI
jgi:hypothetical protein